MINVPREFQPRQKREYPTGNKIPFEEWFFDFYPRNNTEKRIYLPIFWTTYYCNNGWGKKPDPIKRLQLFLNSLPKDKYFTIVQYDDGILNDLSVLDIKVFAMSGNRIDYPLPLICWPYDRKLPTEKKYFCNFVGSNTHPVRAMILRNPKLLIDGWFISDSRHGKNEYMDIMAMSTFTLCPRGYGKTSFRIQEALECGSIPVYISDKFIIPHNIDFYHYGITLTPDKIDDLPNILKSIPGNEIAEKQKNIDFVVENYYSYEANKRLILRNL